MRLVRIEGRLQEGADLVLQDGFETQPADGVAELLHVFEIAFCSRLVAKAKSLGYTEPDPRDDLSGMDVARKIVILAREIGMTLELSDVDVRSLVPEALQRGTAEDFLAALPNHDPDMEALRAEAASRGEVLRFVGRVGRDGGASVALRAYPTSHPFARIQLTDNIVLFRTARYSENPLVVQGPGAGREVTAAGVFADLLRLASYLGAPL